MNPGAWKAILFVLLLGLVGLAYGPLQKTAPLGEQAQTLVRLARMVDPADGEHRAADLWSLGDRGVGPLATATLALDARTWREGGRFGERALYAMRFENLVLLLLAAVAFGAATRRLITPWTGPEHAEAAAGAVAFLIALHPLAVSAVADPAGRGDLLAAALTGAALVAFLTGRQRRRYRFVLLAALLTAGAGAASGAAWFLAPVLALAELFSARRHRPLRVRVRTAATTLVVFGAASLAELFLRGAAGVPLAPARLRTSLASFDNWSDFATAIAFGLERLGVLLVPINRRGTGLFDFVVMGIVLLFVLQPALLAARNAPRFWSAVLASWLAGVLGAQVPAASFRVQPTDFSDARHLLAAAIVMAVGIALASTAVSGKRRTAVPSLAVLAFGLLARAEAECLLRAGREASRLGAELREAAHDFPSAAELWVVAPPGVVRGHRAAGGDLAVWLEPVIAGAQAPPRPPRVRGLSPAALLAAGARAILAERAREGLAILLPASLLSPDAERVEGRRRPFGIPAPPARVSTEPLPVEDLPRIELARLGWRGLRLVTAPGRVLSATPRIEWRAAGQEDRLVVPGLPLWGERRNEAWFDLYRSFAWLAAGGGQGIELRPASPGAVLEPLTTLPTIPGAEAPEVSGADWVFHPRQPAGIGRFVLILLETTRLDCVEIECLRDEDGALVAEGVEPLLAAWRRGGAPVLWSLELRVGSTALARCEGP